MFYEIRDGSAQVFRAVMIVRFLVSQSIPFLATSPGKDRVVLVYSDKIEVRAKVRRILR